MKRTKTAYEKYFKVNITEKAALLSFTGAALVSVIVIGGLWHFAPGLPPVLFPFIAGGLAGGLFVLFVGLGVSFCSCAACGNPLPKVRWPKSREEFLWGGWTCSKCGASMDRFGQFREGNRKGR